MTCDPPPPCGDSIARTLLVATLTAALTGLVTWGIDELRWRYGWRDENDKKEKKP